MLIFGPKDLIPGRRVQSFFQKFIFVSFLFFRPLNFLYNFGKNLSVIPEIIGVRTNIRSHVRMYVSMGTAEIIGLFC